MVATSEEYLILDGYNVINSWPTLKALMDENLQIARDRLIDTMIEYGAYREIQVIIVFDAHLVKGNVESEERRQNVKVVFTRELETADSYIEKLAGQLSKTRKVAVVTNDRIEQQMILGSGAIRIPVRELIENVNKAKNDINKKIQVGKIQKNLLSDMVDGSILARLEKLRRGQ